MTAEDAMEYMLVGARAVQVGTATFLHAGAMLGVIDGLEAFCREKGIDRVCEIIGTLSSSAEDGGMVWEAIA